MYFIHVRREIELTNSSALKPKNIPTYLTRKLHIKIQKTTWTDEGIRFNI